MHSYKQTKAIATYNLSEYAAGKKRKSSTASSSPPTFYWKQANKAHIEEKGQLMLKRKQKEDKEPYKSFSKKEDAY